MRQQQVTKLTHIPVYVHVYIYICMYVSACVCLYLYPCIALGFTSCILWPIIPGFYRSICTRDGFEHEALEKLGHLIAVVHVDGFLMFGSTPAFTDAVAWINLPTKKTVFWVHDLCIRLGTGKTWIG